VDDTILGQLPLPPAKAVQASESLIKSGIRNTGGIHSIGNGRDSLASPGELVRNPGLAITIQCISKKHFRPGGMAPSEWTLSVRAVRDTPEADYSTPGVNATRRVAYCPLNAVSPFLLAQSVS